MLVENLREEQQITLAAWSCRQQLIATHRQVGLLPFSSNSDSL